MKKGLSLLLLTLMFLFLGCPSASLNTARIAYFNEQDYDHAKEACLAGIKTEPENFELYSILGGSEFGLGNWQPGAKAFTTAFQKDSIKTLKWIFDQKGSEGYYYQGCYNAARDLYEKKDYEGALTLLEYAERIIPTDTRTFTLRGAIQYTLGNKEAANEEYKKALKCAPENPDVHFLIGKSLFEGQKFEESKTYFSDAIKYYEPQYGQCKKVLFQNLPEADEKIEREIISLWKGQDKKRLDNLVKTRLGFEVGLPAQSGNIEKLYKITDGMSRAYYFLGMSYYNLKNDSLALKNLKISLDLMSDDVDALFYMGEILIRFKKFEEAKGYFERITQELPEDFAAWFYLGVCYSELKNYKKAIEIYEEKALPLAPDNIALLTNLAYVYREIGNTKKAYEYLMKVDSLEKKEKEKK